MLDRLKARLVDDWREASRWWSVRLNMLGAIVLPLVTLVPSMPAEVQAMFPPAMRATIAGLWCIASIAARLFVQRRA
jgi:hypothetical protein